MMCVGQNRTVLLQAQRYILGAEKAMVLPSRSNPKLLVPFCDITARGRLSAFFPAFKLKARCWRLLQRVRCVTGLAPLVSSPQGETFRLFIDDVLPGISHTAVLIGTSGPHQKIVVQLWRGSELAGYLKVAATSGAGKKIHSEVAVLERLPQGLGPRLLKVGELDGHPAMMMSPVMGTMLPARLPEATDIRGLMLEVRGYLDQLKLSDTLFEMDCHPAILRIRKLISADGGMSSDLRPPNSDFLDSLLEPLRTQKWPVVIQHGDFAPWNVLRTAVMNGQKSTISPEISRSKKSEDGGLLFAIDWEEGTAEGFPHFDLIHYVSQTAALVEKWTPEQCARYMMQSFPDLDESTRRAVIKLGLVASWLMLRRSLDGHHWILDWKQKAWGVVDEL